MSPPKLLYTKLPCLYQGSSSLFIPLNMSPPIFTRASAHPRHCFLGLRHSLTPRYIYTCTPCSLDNLPKNSCYLSLSLVTSTTSTRLYFSCESFKIRSFTKHSRKSPTQMNTAVWFGCGSPTGVLNALPFSAGETQSEFKNPPKPLPHTKAEEPVESGRTNPHSLSPR
jgi:hypothetical protein